MYSNYKLGLSRKDYTPANDNKKNGLSIERLPGKGNYKIYKAMLGKVGGPWLWDKRPKYANDNEALRQRIARLSTTIHLFQYFNQTIGYSLTVERPDLSSQFNKVAEIENFGLVPEFNGKGLGDYFLHETFKYLFEHGYDNIHLESRSTNHEKVIPFYQRNGMKLIEVDKNLPDDLVP